MRRRLFTLVAALSLLLCAATMVLWVRSFHPQRPPAMYADRLLYSNGYIATYRGTMTIVYFDDEHGSDRPFDHRASDWHGFVLSRSRGYSGWNADWQYTSLDFPLLAVMVLTFLPTLAALPLVWRRKPR